MYQTNQTWVHYVLQYDPISVIEMFFLVLEDPVKDAELRI
jgi:hypothetical protein